MSSINPLVIETTQGLLADLINTANVIGEEITLACTPEGVSGRVWGLDNVQLIDFAYTPADFIRYECPSSVRFGLTLADAHKIVKHLGKEKEPVTITLDNKYVIFTGKSTFRLRIKETATKDQRPITIPFPATIKIARETIAGIIEAIGAIDSDKSAYLYIDSFEPLDAGKCIIYTKSDSGEAEHILGPSETKGEEIESTFKAKVIVAYRVAQTLAILQAAKTIDRVAISFGTNSPLKLELGKMIYYQGCKADYPEAPKPAQMEGVAAE